MENMWRIIKHQFRQGVTVFEGIYSEKSKFFYYSFVSFEQLDSDDFICFENPETSPEFDKTKEKKLKEAINEYINNKQCFQEIAFKFFVA